MHTATLEALLILRNYLFNQGKCCDSLEITASMMERMKSSVLYKKTDDETELALVEGILDQLGDGWWIYICKETLNSKIKLYPKHSLAPFNNEFLSFKIRPPSRKKTHTFFTQIKDGQFIASCRVFMGFDVNMLSCLYLNRLNHFFDYMLCILPNIKRGPIYSFVNMICRLS